VLKYIIKNEEIDQNGFENETGKSSQLNLKSMTFPSEEDAKEYLNDMVSDTKAFIVKFLGSTDVFEGSEKYEEINSKIQKMKIEMLEFPLNIINRFNEQKSSTKGCSNCKSSIDKEVYSGKMIQKYNELDLNENSEEILKDLNNENNINRLLKQRFELLNCPICDSSNFILNETDNEKFNKFSEKIEELKNKLEEEKVKFYNKSEKKTLFLIGFMD
jgi:hypothetical protein